MPVGRSRRRDSIVRSLFVSVPLPAFVSYPSQQSRGLRRPLEQRHEKVLQQPAMASRIQRHAKLSRFQPRENADVADDARARVEVVAALGEIAGNTQVAEGIGDVPVEVAALGRRRGCNAENKQGMREMYPGVC